MGQGTLTGLAQLVAEELECDWSKVTTEYPTPGESVASKRAWGAFSTGGSRGIRESEKYVREGGAAARMMLIQAAANEWKVPASECTASNSTVTHSSGKTITYGKLAEAAAKLERAEGDQAQGPEGLEDRRQAAASGSTPPTRSSARWNTASTSSCRECSTPRSRQCPVFGGKVKSYDAAKVEKMPGVKKVVQVGDNAVAVVADTFWHAKTALDALPIEWDTAGNEKVDSASIAKFLEDRPRSRSSRRSSATRTATSKPPSPARPRRSRPSTRIRTRTTRRWSR